MRKNGIVIAIDGPAGAGKSTTAKRVAEKMGYLYLDTGAMYRAVALATLRQNINPEDSSAVTVLSEGLQITFDTQNSVLLNGEDVSDAIRSSEVSQASSRVAVHQGVRDVLVSQQQIIGKDGGIVLEGRDTGTAIFPDAELKVFLVADPLERAQRRLNELKKRGESADLDTLLTEIRKRDERDRQTQLRFGPWPAEDAVSVDTTGVSIEDQVDQVVLLARQLDS
ncbi:MAG: (d)CMP kinase [Candidatus Latescibacteria bacterium]|nr:(d)CMP kinase [Candidatus Latescibacterota bacterium]